MTSSNKRILFEALIDEVRRSQTATARFDAAVAAAVGLNLTDMGCVDLLSRLGALTAGQLADHTGLSSGAMTTALDRLEQSGFARRVRDPQDRRRVLVELTEKAQALEGFYQEHRAHAERLCRQYSEHALEIVLEFVRGGRELNERRAAEVERDTRAAH